MVLEKDGRWEFRSESGDRFVFAGVDGPSELRASEFELEYPGSVQPVFDVVAAHNNAGLVKLDDGIQFLVGARRQ